MNTDKGFSLIELIITIAIMAVLVAIIASNLTRYIGSARVQVDKRNLDEVHQQVMNCLSECVTRVPHIDVIAGEDGIKIAEYELSYDSSNDITSVTAKTNGVNDFATELYNSMKKANTHSKVDATKTVIRVYISGSVKNGYEVSEKYD